MALLLGAAFLLNETLTPVFDAMASGASYVDNKIYDLKQKLKKRNVFLNKRHKVKPSKDLNRIKPKPSTESMTRDSRRSNHGAQDR